jgi:hypothetical protein
VADEQEPFADVIVDADGFTIPELKWRELLFVGALREEHGLYVRDPAHPLPPFRIAGLFPESTRFRAVREGLRIRLRAVHG